MQKRALAALGVYLAAVAVLGSLLAPVAWSIWQSLLATGTLHGLADTPFRRIADRSFMLIAFAGLYPLLRALQLNGRRDWGYDLAGRHVVPAVAGGLLFGLVSMAGIVLIEYAAGICTRDVEESLPVVIEAFVSGLGAGLIIGVLEEIFFRGALFAVVRRSYGPRAAVWATAWLYAVLHFIRSHGEFSDIHWYSGFAVLGQALANVGSPDMWGAFLALLIVGIMLAVVRERVGHVFIGMGAHAGWVAVIKVGRQATNLNWRSPLAWLASGYDGITGYLAAAVLLVFLIILLSPVGKRLRATAPPEEAT